MNDLLGGMARAAKLLVSLDADLVQISILSLRVSLTATLIASAIGLPLGAWLAVATFPGSGQAHFQLGTAYLSSGDLARAAASLTEECPCRSWN